MRFHKQIEFGAPPDVVWAMLADRDFRESVAREAGSASYDIAVTETDTGLRATIDTRQPATGLPGFARRIVGHELAIHQEEHWSPAGTGTLEVSIPGRPGHVKGDVALTQVGSGTVQTVDAEVKVHLPLVGGRIETMICQVLGNLLKLQGRVGERWLNGER